MTIDTPKVSRTIHDQVYHIAGGDQCFVFAGPANYLHCDGVILPDLWIIYKHCISEGPQTVQWTDSHISQFFRSNGLSLGWYAISLGSSVELILKSLTGMMMEG